MFLRKLFTPALVCFLFLTLAACNHADSAGAEKNSKDSDSSEGLPRLIELGADKCVPCKMMAPILEELEEKYAGRMEVRFIDVWKNREKASEYRVQMIPTQIFFDEKGNELYRHTGFIAKEDILAKWQELGYDFND